MAGSNPDENLVAWKKLVSRAKSNGLIAHRIEGPKGASQRPFNPWGVYEWLQAKGKLTPAENVVLKRLLEHLNEAHQYLAECFK